tara:strand:+ start:763 stop:1239 length:477 start_codon:yes stop_codon:yes gene_type:complete
LRVLAIDPGIRTTGFGVLDSKINKLSLVACGTINPKPNDTIPIRLNYLFEEVDAIINKFSPDIFSIEDMFYSKNVKTSMILGQARGAMIIAAAQAGLLIYEYAPKKVKMSVCGNGGASKQQVKYMVMKILNLKDLPGTMDISDAIAVGICCLNQVRLK